MSKLSPQQFQDYLMQIRALAEGPLEEIQKEVEVTNKFPQEFYDLAIENDLYRCALPEEYGGYGLSELEILQVQEEFSRGPGGMRMHLHYAMDLNWRILDDYGNEELKAEYMPKFQDKSVFTCFALTEAAGGTGADLHTTAVRDGDSYILNGEKTLISHTDCCEFAYVIAVTNPESDKADRLSAFFVPMDAPGFEVINMPHMMGCRGAKDTGILSLRTAALTRNTCWERKDRDLRSPFTPCLVSRAHIAASDLGMAQRMLEMSLKYAADRVTFGKPIITRQAIRMKIANMQMNIHALRCMVYDFARDYEVEAEGPYIEEKAAMCKLFSIDTVRLVSDEMLEIFGGVGYFEDNPYGPVERMYRDCRAMWLEEGAPTVQRITISKSAVKFGGQVKYVI